MCCILQSTRSRETITGFHARLMCFRGRPHISVVRKLANKFTLCSITVAPASVPSLQPSKAGFGLIYVICKLA